MQRRANIVRMILASVVILGLAPLMAVVDAQAQIAFVSERDGNAEIYVMDNDGNNQRRLTNNPDKDYSPSWSPNGKRIIFMSNRDGHAHFIPGLFTYEIYIMDADGSNPQNLTNNPADDRSPSWSPDGKRIAFTADRKGDLVNFEIYAMDANGENEQRLTENRSDDWSPNGERITFRSERDGNGEIYVIDADGGNPQNLSNNPHSDFGPAWLNSPFSVSAVGKKFMMWGWLKQVD